MTRRIVTAVARIDDLCEAVIDCPPAHTMYLDKPLARHNLMQAIARVNRVYGDKPGGLIVDRWAWLISWPMRWRRTQAGGTGAVVRKVRDEAVPAMATLGFEGPTTFDKMLALLAVPFRRLPSNPC